MSTTITKQVTIVYRDGSAEVAKMPIRNREKLATPYIRLGSRLVAAGKAVAGISGDRGYVWVGHNGDGNLFRAVTAGAYNAQPHASAPEAITATGTMHYGQANEAPRLPAGARSWDSTRHGGRLHVVDADGKVHVAPTRADMSTRKNLPSE